MSGRTILVTGANSGIGLEVARDLVRRGAHVVLAVRDTTRGAVVASQLDGPGTTTVMRLDLADLDLIPASARELLTRYDDLSALVANAGIMGGPLRRSAQGHELQMATNHLGHAALIAGLWPLLEASRSRLVLVTSGEARDGHLSPATERKELLDPEPYEGRQAYRNSKQANLLFAQELHRRGRESGSQVTAVAAHPGAAGTDLLARQLDRAGRPRLAALSKGITRATLPSASSGARSTLRALDLDIPSGAFIGPARLGQLHGPPRSSTSTPRRATPRPPPASGNSPRTRSAPRFRSGLDRRAGRRTRSWSRGVRHPSRRPCTYSVLAGLRSHRNAVLGPKVRIGRRGAGVDPMSATDERADG